MRPLLVAGLVVLLFLGPASRVSAQREGSAPALPAWPKVVFDTTMAVRLSPPGGPPTLGPAVGVVFRPTDTHCLHLVGELRADFGRIESAGEDVRTRGVAMTVGALWGSGDEDLFVGVGAVFDLGYASTQAAADVNGFVFTGAMRGLVRRRLRKGFHVLADLRIGHTIVAESAFDASGASVGPRGIVVGLALGAAFARAPGR